MANNPHVIADPNASVSSLLGIDDDIIQEDREFQAPVEFVENSELGDYKQKQIDDYMFARNTLQEAINSGHKALEGALDSAFGSHHPRSYEVAGQIMKQISEATEKLMVLNEKFKKLLSEDKTGKNGEVTQNNQQNNFFVTGTTEDLAAALEKLNGSTSNIIDSEITHEKENV